MRSIVLSVGLVAVVVAGCSDDSAPEAGSTTSASLRTTSSATLENRSQTIDEAHRDGVIAKVSALGIAERVDLQMPRTPPSWIHVSPDAVYAGHIGDGGLPNSTLVRIDRQTLAAQVVVFPQPDSPGPWPVGWHVATGEETAAYPQLVRMGPDESGTTAVSEIGRVVIDEALLDRLFSAL